MKKLLLFLFALFSCSFLQAQVAINEENFPESSFREYIKSKFDLNGDYILDQQELNSATEIQYNLPWGIPPSELTAKGLEHFHNLRKLSFHGIRLVSGYQYPILLDLDLSKNPLLEELSLAFFRMESLSLTDNVNLKKINIQVLEDLSEIDLSTLSDLKELTIDGSDIEILNLKNNPSLEILSLTGNTLPCLDLSNQHNLQSLTLANNVYVAKQIGCLIDLDKIEGLDINKISNMDDYYGKIYGYSLYINDKITKYTYDTECPIEKFRFCDFEIWLDLPVKDLEPSYSERNFYDLDQDGFMEVFKESGNVDKWDGEKFKQYQNLNNSYRGGTLFSGNNDGIPDVYSESNGSSVILSRPDSSFVSFPDFKCYGALDLNNDGLKDFFGLNNLNWSVYYQNRDGSFTKTVIDTLSRNDVDSLLYKRWNYTHTGGAVVTNGIPSLSDEMFADRGGNNNNLDYKFVKSIDVNMDGYIDLVGVRNIFYNMGDNHFISVSQPGDVIVRDLTGDDYPDYIYNDTENKKIYTRIYQGKGELKDQVLMKDLDVSDVYCYDFDKDGDVDILLTFNYTDKFQYSYLVLCINDGKGNFTIKENAYTEKFLFTHCIDVDNDGYMELLAHWDKKYYYEDDDMYLFRVDASGDVVKPEKPFSPYVHGILDFDHNGIIDFFITPNRRYKLTDLAEFRDIPANEAPQKMQKPEYVLDQINGKLKVFWNKGVDKETSSVDLTYALRIGSKPGADDIYFSEANADGSRRSVSEGNMGVSRETILDVSRWKNGNYYISVQTVDPMGMGSPWSDEVVYYHNLTSAAFTVSKENVMPNDTLVLTCAPLSENIHYQWNIEDGKIIDAEADSSRVYVQFTEPGIKQIALTVVNDATGYSETKIQKIFSSYIGVTKDRDIIDHACTFSDFNMDGSLDNVANCLYTNDGEGNFIKVPSIFNSNLSISYNSQIMDFDMDGDLDYLVKSNKGNVILNYGNNVFEGVTKEFTVDNNSVGYLGTYGIRFLDYDNDGLLDFVNDDIGKTIFKNKGDNMFFERNDGFGSDYPKVLRVMDFNKDGFWDYVKINSDYVQGEFVRNITLCINNGDFTFTEFPLNINKEFDPHTYEDINNDGFIDVLTTKGVVLLGGENYSFSKACHLPVLSNQILLRDLDNNGCLDVISYRRINDSKYFLGVLFMEPDMSYHEEQIVSKDLYYIADLDNDGYLDLIDSWENLNKTKNHKKNSNPESPKNIRVIQQGDGVLLQWEHAKDQETPFAQMRYNVSVKKKGENGEGAFIISPLNGLNDKAKAIPLEYDYEGHVKHLYYQRANQKLIPIDRFEEGQEYEVQIQSIDLQDACSPMSIPVAFTVNKQVLLSAPHEAYTNQNVKVLFKGTENPSEGIWQWDGATVVADGREYSACWSTPGLKNVSVEINGVFATVPILVKESPDLSFDLPDTGLAGTEISFELPEDFVLAPKNECFYSIKKDGFISNDLVIQQYGQTSHAKLVIKKEGKYEIELQMNNSSTYGNVSYKRNIEVLDAIPLPVIKLVGIDAATGKNKVTWDMPNMPKYVTGIHIYKEGGSYNEFSCVARLDTTEHQYIDFASNPSVVSNRYMIKLGTSFGVESQPSKVHSGVHLMLNKGMGNAINLIWNQYEGGIIKSYRILRGTSKDNLEVLAEISGANSSYTDLDGGNGVYFYALEYDETYSDEWHPVSLRVRSLQNLFGRSNVVCTDEAYAVKFAESLNILCVEKDMVLSQQQPTLHLSAEIFPVTAGIKQVQWEIVEGGELASINQNGMLTAKSAKSGEVVVRATTIDGSGLYTEAVIKKEGYIVIPENIEIFSEDGIAEINPSIDYVQLTAVVYPEEASQNVIWSIVEGTNLATVSSTGLVKATAVGNGKIVVRAKAPYPSEIYGEYILDKYGYPEMPNRIEISEESGTYVITPEKTTLTFTAKVFPEELLSEVIWSLDTGDDLATINADGVLTAKGRDNGEIIVRATSVLDDQVYATVTIIKDGFFAKPYALEVYSYEDAVLTPEHSSLSLTAKVYPEDLSQDVIWSIDQGEEFASITQDGILSAFGNENGIIIVRATSVLDDQIYGTIYVEKKDFISKPYALEIHSDTVAVLTPEHSSLSLTANVYPEYLSQEVIWSIDQGEDLATISQNGVLSACGNENGIILVRATSVLNSDVYDQFSVTKSDFVTTLMDFTTNVPLDIYIKNNKLYIFGCTNSTKLSLILVDLTGRKFNVPMYKENTHLVLDLMSLAQGTYILRVNNGESEKVFRFIR